MKLKETIVDNFFLPVFLNAHLAVLVKKKNPL